MSIVSMFLDEAVGKNDKENQRVARGPLTIAFTDGRIRGMQAGADAFASIMDGGPG